MNRTQCPDQEKVAAFASGRLDDARREALFLHFMTCDACCRSLRFSCECLVADRRQSWPIVTSQESEHVRRVFDWVIRMKDMPSESALLWLRFSQALTPARDVMAVADGQTSDQRLQAAALSGHICFFADCGKQLPDYWQARIALPVAPAPETELRIRVQDAKGEPIARGTFVLCGIELPVSDGCAKVRLADLQGHLDTPIVAMRFPDGKKSSGTPRLFDAD
jgi:hypothetical protein